MMKKFIWLIIVIVVFLTSFMLGNSIGSKFEFTIQESAIKQNVIK